MMSHFRIIIVITNIVSEQIKRKLLKDVETVLQTRATDLHGRQKVETKYFE